MAKQTTYSTIMAKLGDRARKAWEAHKHDEVDLGNMGDLPAGIQAGVAQLVDCKIGLVEEGKQSAGQPFFYAAGVVLSPKTFTHPDGTVEPLEGRRTSILEMLCDTPNSGGRRKTQGEHMAWMMNELKKLGADVENASVDDLPALMEALKEAQPFFRFRTWKGSVQKTGPYAGKDPKTQHTWNGQCEYEGGGTPADAVLDETDTTEDETGESDAAMEAPPPPPSRTVRSAGNGKPSAARLPAKPTTIKPVASPTVRAAKQPSAPPSKPVAPAKPGKKAPPPPPAEDEELGEESFDEFSNDSGTQTLTQLGEAADGGDEAAKEALITRAEAAGFTTDDVAGADSWGAVAEMIEGAEANAGETQGEESAAEEPAEEQETEWEPSVGDVYKYRPIDPKTKRPTAKSIECEVLRVDKKARMCDLRNMDDRKTLYKTISWDKLESAG